MRPMRFPTTRCGRLGGLVAALALAAGGLVTGAGSAMAAPGAAKAGSPNAVVDCDPAGSILLNPTTVVSGQTVSVGWNAIQIDGCNPPITSVRMSGPGFSGDEVVGRSGSRQVTLTQPGPSTATWVLKITTRFGQTSLDTQSVSVVAPVPTVLGLAGGAVSFADPSSRQTTAELHSIAAGNGPAVRSGTRVSIAPVAGDFDEAYQGTDGNLWIVLTGGRAAATGLGMAVGTSPSIVALDSSNVEVAFQANTGALWTYNTLTGVAHSVGFGMAAGSSPAAALTSSGVAIAFANQNGDLCVVDPVTGFGGFGTPTAPVAPGTSPAITYILHQTDGYEIAYQAPDHSVRTADFGHSATFPTPLTAAAGTSPAITTLPNGEIDLASAGTNGLVTDWKLGASNVTGVATYRSGTSPSIAAAAGGGTVTAWEAVSGNVNTFQAAIGVTDTGLVELAGDSPVIAQVTDTTR